MFQTYSRYQCLRKLQCLLIVHEGDVIWINSDFSNSLSRWWLQIFFIFTPIIGEDEPISTNICSKGVGEITK